MKKALLITICLLAVGYLIFSVFYFKDKPKGEVCNDFQVEVSNADDSGSFVDALQVKAMVQNKGLSPVGHQLKDINTLDIEQLVLTNKHIHRAKVYFTNKNNVHILIEERKPIMRIIPNGQSGYYLDQEGEVMPLSRHYTTYLPVATGYITEDYAKKELYGFAKFLKGDKFWNAQIDQIVVENNKDVLLIPRVGEHRILLGKLTDYEERLDKMLNFYKDGLNSMGWNKYLLINLKYDKQVVCKKR